MSTSEKGSVKAAQAKQPAKDGNLRRICTGQGSGSRFLNVWSN
jgi:hypothetical protein